MTTQDGDVIQWKASGSGKVAAPGDTINVRFVVMCFAHTASVKYADLNSIGLVGHHDVTADGSTVGKGWEWK